MLLSPSRADCIVFELEGVLVSAVAEGEVPEQPAEVLYAGRWDKLPLPAGVVTALDREKADKALAALKWTNGPVGRAVDAPALDSICRALGARRPLLLGASAASRDALAAFGRGDFVAVGYGVPGCPVRFTSAADALRAILGVV